MRGWLRSQPPHWIGVLFGVPKLAENEETARAAGLLLGTMRMLIRSPAFSALLFALVQVVAVSEMVHAFVLAACVPPAGVTITVNV